MSSRGETAGWHARSKSVGYHAATISPPSTVILGRVSVSGMLAQREDVILSIRESGLLRSAAGVPIDTLALYFQ
jgi:hypothetical protein